ncbi:MAG: hypothetical protein LAP87_08260 [Acidobacteriia bacterium]|nr:hypothetical protein [Terriglobia bacterium]
MNSFLITELDDRYEFGIAVVDDDALSEWHGSCSNTTACCGTNNSCTNSADCGCPGGCPKPGGGGGAEDEDASS